MTTESNVVSMGDFLVRRFHKLVDEGLRLNDLADDLSKQDKDKFAAPVRAKAEKLKKDAEAVRDHIRFIAKGGNVGGLHLNPQGYSIHTGIAPMVVSMKLDTQNPTPTK